MTPDLKVTDELIDKVVEVIASDGYESEKTKELIEPVKDNKLELLQLIIKKPNISWVDLVTIEAEIHSLQIELHGKNLGGRPKDGIKIGWSAVDTARELKRAIGTFSEDLRLAEALKQNPGLSKIKDKTTAIKLVRRMAAREINELESLIQTPNMDQVLLGDSLDILKLFPDKTFDACITDPPWTEFRDPELCADEHTLPIFREIFRVLKSDAFLYAVLSTPDFISYSKILPTFGFRVQEYPIIWQKVGGMTHGSSGWQHARDYEPILLAVKGAPVLTSSTEVSSIFPFQIVHHTRMIHPNEKPLDLAKTLVRTCTFAGGKILDPFAGSGVFVHAAKELDRRYVAIERNPKFHQNIVKRLK